MANLAVHGTDDNSLNWKQRKRKTWIFQFRKIIDQELPALSLWTEENRASECYPAPTFIKKTEKKTKKGQQNKEVTDGLKRK